MIKRKRGYKIPAVLSVICWLVFIWLRTFTHMTNYDEGTGVYSFLIAAVITLLGTFLYWSLLKPEENVGLLSLIFEYEFEDYSDEITDEPTQKWSTLRKSMLVVGCLALLCLVAFAFEMWTDITVFTDSTYIDIGLICINKKYMFDPILFIVFPLWIQVVFRGVREESYSTKAVLSGSVQLIMLSLISYLLFMKLPNIWLIELAAVEIIILVAAFRKYVWRCCKKKGNGVALIGLYVLFWCALLAVFYRAGMTFSQYTFGGDWDAYRNNVAQIISGASAFGSSPELLSNSVVIEFLANRNNYFLSGLYYGGWVSGVVIVVVLLLFLVMSYRILGNNATLNRNYLVYKASWWTLATRIIVGIPYSMGLFPVPISLPFAGKIGFYMDTIALGLLLWSIVESKNIDKAFYKDRRISELFEGEDLLFEREEVEGRLDLFEIVQVCSGDTTLNCFVEEYEQYNALVLEPMESDEECVLIVAKGDDSEVWHDVEDDSVRKEILREYMKNNGPSYMEVIE